MDAKEIFLDKALSLFNTPFYIAKNAMVSSRSPFFYTTKGLSKFGVQRW